MMKMMMVMALMMLVIIVPKSTTLRRGMEIVKMTAMLMGYRMLEMPAHATNKFRWQTLTTLSPFH